MKKNRKLEALRKHLRQFDACAVALSGGQDSLLVLDMAREVLGDRATAMTVFAPYTLKRDVRSACDIASTLGVEHITLEVPLAETLRFNPPDRCYICKTAFFALIGKEAGQRGITAILDGTNADDDESLRPGMKSLSERGIVSPLRECGFTKRDIAETLQERGRSGWIKSADSCLLTRFPAGREVMHEELVRVEMAEEFLLAEGIDPVRVRNDGRTARIETARESRIRFLDEPFMDRVADQLKRFGFFHVALDLAGYEAGRGQNSPRTGAGGHAARKRGMVDAL